MQPEEVEWVAQRVYGCLPGSVQDRARWGFEHFGTVQDISAYGRGFGTR